jgi:phosphate transport system substrate-binding protein
MRISSAVFSLALIIALSGCGKSEDGPVNKQNSESGGSSSGGNIDITGAGASFPYPLYSKWIHEYNKANPKIRISYQSIGSGGGIRQISANTVDFGASDAPMKDDELAKTGNKLVHIPMTIGAVAVVFNVEGVDKLKLDGDTLVAIFMGEIKKWNDPKIAALNDGAELPDSDITVAYRSDGSGTTAVFTDYLSAVSPAWKEKVGAGKSVKFPTGIGAKGNEGVAGQIKTAPGTIGYVELAYAIQTKLSYAALANQAGNYVEPSLEGISAAAAGEVAEMPDDYRISIVNAPGDKAYPIAAFTYILVYKDMKDPTKAKALVDFLWWAIHDGQAMGPDLHYAKLPPELVSKVEKTLQTLTAGGKPLLAK